MSFSKVFNAIKQIEYQVGEKKSSNQSKTKRCHKQKQQQIKVILDKSKILFFLYFSNNIMKVGSRAAVGLDISLLSLVLVTRWLNSIVRSILYVTFKHTANIQRRLHLLHYEIYKNYAWTCIIYTLVIKHHLNYLTAQV